MSSNSARGDPRHEVYYLGQFNQRKSNTILEFSQIFCKIYQDTKLYNLFI